MSLPKTSALKIILALLPVVIPITPFDVISHVAGFVSLAVLGATCFFALTAPLFPKKFLPLTLVLFVATVFQVASYFTSVNPLWIVSFFILFDWNDIDRNRLGVKTYPLLPRLGLFLGGALWLGLSKDILGRQQDIPFFLQPSGVLALMVVLAYAFSIQWGKKTT